MLARTLLIGSAPAWYPVVGVNAKAVKRRPDLRITVPSDEGNAMSVQVAEAIVMSAPNSDWTPRTHSESGGTVSSEIATSERAADAVALDHVRRTAEAAGTPAEKALFVHDPDVMRAVTEILARARAIYDGELPGSAPRLRATATENPPSEPVGDPVAFVQRTAGCVFESITPGLWTAGENRRSVDLVLQERRVEQPAREHRLTGITSPAALMQ